MVYIYMRCLIDAVFSSLYHILYQVHVKSVLGQILLITCLSLRSLSALGKWEGLPLTLPSHASHSLPPGPEVSIVFTQADNAALPEALHLLPPVPRRSLCTVLEAHQTGPWSFPPRPPAPTPFPGAMSSSV